MESIFDVKVLQGAVASLDGTTFNLGLQLLSLLSTIHALHRVIFGPQYGPGPWKTRNENLFAFHRFKCLNPMRTHHYGCYLRYEVKRGFCAQETGTEKTPSVLNQCVSGKLLINNVFSCVLCTLFGKFPHIFCLPGQAFCVNDLQLHRRLKRTCMKSLLRVTYDPILSLDKPFAQMVYGTSWNFVLGSG